MVRNYVKKREPYNKEDMLNAIKAVESGEMGYKKGSVHLQCQEGDLAGPGPEEVGLHPRSRSLLSHLLKQNMILNK